MTPESRAEAADDAREQQDRQRERERVGIDVRDLDREQRARDARVERRRRTRASCRAPGSLSTRSPRSRRRGSTATHVPFSHARASTRRGRESPLRPTLRSRASGAPRCPTRRARSEVQHQPTATAGELVEPLRDPSETANANVASASETPASRSAGIPKRTPMMPVMRPARDREDRSHAVLERHPVGRPQQQRLELRPAEGQHRSDVRTDAHERAVPERDLPVVAREDVQSEERDEVDRDERELRGPELGLRSAGARRSALRRRRRGGLQRGERHTRRTATWPNSPCGWMISTSRRTASAVGRRARSRRSRRRRRAG